MGCLREFSQRFYGEKWAIICDLWFIDNAINCGNLEYGRKADEIIIPMKIIISTDPSFHSIFLSDVNFGPPSLVTLCNVNIVQIAIYKSFWRLQKHLSTIKGAQKDAPATKRLMFKQICTNKKNSDYWLYYNYSASEISKFLTFAPYFEAFV